MTTQEKIDAYLDQYFIIKSEKKCKWRKQDKYLYLMDYLKRLYLLRNYYWDKKYQRDSYTIRDKGRIANEIWRVQETLKELADKLKIDLPKKYHN